MPYETTELSNQPKVLQEDPHLNLQREVDELAPSVQVLSGSHMRIVVDDTEGAYFKAEPSPVMHIGAAFAAERAPTEEKRKLIVYHEAGHFIEYLTDPTTYQAFFDEEAKETDPQVQAALRQFHNIMLDIDDNGRTIKRSTVFQQGERFGNTPRDLYNDNLFPSVDFTDKPLCQQFGYALIRRTMVPDVDVTVAPEVANASTQPFDFLGIHYTDMYDFVNRMVYSPSTSFKLARFAIENKVEPVFRALMKQDIEAGRDIKPVEGKGEGSADGFDPLDPKNFEGIDKYLKDRDKTGSERAKENFEKNFRKHMKDLDLTDEQAQAMWERVQRTEKTVQALKEFWWHLIHRSTGYERTATPGFTTGSRLNLPATIAQLPILLTNPSQAAIFERDNEEPAQGIIHPRHIKLIQQLDASGSMFTDPRRILNAGDASYALATSLIAFFEEGKLNNPGDFPIDVSTVIIPYGGAAVVDFFDVAVTNPQQARNELFKKIGAIETQTDGTNDNAAHKVTLEKIQAIPPDQKEDQLLIVLQITDGGTQSLDASKKTIALIKQAGATTRAVQIVTPSLSPEDRATFKDEWGETDGKQLEELDKLLPTLQKLFADILVHGEE